MPATILAQWTRERRAYRRERNPVSLAASLKKSGTPSNALSRFQKCRRIALALLVGLILIALLFVRSSFGVDDRVHEYVEAAGGAMLLAAILGRTWCTLYIGGRKSTEIVKDGPYSVTRNPLYVFSTIGAAGIGAMTGSLTVAVGFAVVSYLAFYFVTLVEEEYLAQTFDQPYRQYMQEVPRFFPRLRLFRESEMLSVPPWILYRTFADGLMFLAAYPFFEFVEYMQGTGMLPVLLRLP
jgi:protein-S-isoprenylcysteine O-methyltransferase Ste14